MATSYLVRLPRSFMRPKAGFSHERAELYHLKRAVVEPPQSLQRRIWPWLDEAACTQQNRVPQRLLPVPPESVKESFLNESFSNTLSTTALPSHSPSASGLASDVPPATVAPGPSVQPNDCPEGWPVGPITHSMKSMAEVWQEWHYGLGGNLS